MRVNKIEFSNTQINAEVVTVQDAYLDISVSGGYGTNSTVETIRKYPLNASLVNTSGAAIEVAFLSNDDEYTDFLDNPSNYYFLIPNNSALNSSNKMGRIYKVAVKKATGDVTSGVRIDFINFVGSTVIEEN